MSLSREQIGQNTAAKLRSALPGLKSIKGLIGLDGFVDSIIAVVDKRQDAENYTPIKTITQFGGKISAAAGQSSNYELFVTMQKLGGNGPIMANALAAHGLAITYVGNLGFPEPHPVFKEFTERAEVITVAEPGYTDALEFGDGKLMLGKHQHMRDVSWDTLKRVVGLDKLTKLVDQSKLVGFVNWTMLPFLSDIWAKVETEILPKVSKAQRIFFIDLADPEKRTREDLKHATELMTKFQSHLDVILGLNLSESTQILKVLGLPVPADIEGSIEQTAIAIRNALGLYAVVVHPRKGAAAATKDQSAVFKGPFVAEPKISTGAGDHFNAGFCLGQVLGLSLEESLCTGVGTSGYYVRTAISPSAAELADFVEKLPPPQD